MSNVFILKPIKGNKQLPSPLTLEERRDMIEKLAALKAKELDILKVDWHNDPQMKDTPQRYAKMMVNELLVGRFDEPPELKEFDNTEEHDNLLTLGPIPVKSLCAHHCLPIEGQAFVSVLYNKKSKVLGISKFARIVNHFARRFQIQEELVEQIADYIEKAILPAGIGIRIEAKHFCMAFRGVNIESNMVNTALRGTLLEDISARQEFLEECRNLSRRG